MAENKKTLERRIQAYPRPRNFKLFKAEAKIFIKKDSEFFNQILEDRYRNYSQAEINNLLSIKVV